MRKKLIWIAVFLISLTSLKIISFAQGDVPRMTKEELRAVMDKPGVVIIDVRLGGSWTQSDSKIKGAIREDPGAAPSWTNKYSKDQTLVFYCT